MILLASASPRRAEILQRHGVDFLVEPANIDESVKANEPAKDYVFRLAKEKAKDRLDILDTHNCKLVLAADTCIALGTQILGKPDNFEDFVDTLNQLSGKSHLVHSGVALLTSDKKSEALVVTTEVSFRDIKESEMLAYWQSGEPQDKAGSYGIQGLAAEFVTAINGSYSNVVGLPVYETMSLLSRWNVSSKLNPQR